MWDCLDIQLNPISKSGVPCFPITAVDATINQIEELFSFGELFVD